MLQLLLAGRFEGMHLQGGGVQLAKDLLDEAVLAGCVPGLNGDDEALLPGGIELLLQEGALGHILLRPGDKLLLLRRGLRTGGGLFQAE